MFTMGAALRAGGEADPFFSSVVLLAHGGAVLVDRSQVGRTLTAVGTVSLAGAGGPFGGGLIDFGGGHIDVAVGADLNIGTRAYTFECWINEATLSSGKYICGMLQFIGSPDYPGPLFMSTHSLGRLEWYEYNLLGAYNGAATSSSYPRIAAQWNHLAFVRTDNGAGIGEQIAFVNGVEALRTAPAANLVLQIPTVFNLGRWPLGGSTLVGQLAEIRLTVAAARYTSGFAVPTAPFPDA